MENLIIDIKNNLNEIGFIELSDSTIKEALEKGDKSQIFNEIIQKLFEEIESISETNSEVENKEISLNEKIEKLGFPFEISTLFKSIEMNYQLLNFLFTELKTCRLINNKTKINIYRDSKTEQNENENEKLEEKKIKSLLFSLCNLLEIDTSEITNYESILSEIDQKIQELLQNYPKEHLQNHLISPEDYSNEELKEISNYLEFFDNDFQTRQKMLLERLEVTLQAFLWSEQGKKNQEKILEIIDEAKSYLNDCRSKIGILDLFCANDDILSIRKTSDSTVKEISKVSGVLIDDNVPDRGGRPDELKDTRMPAFRARSFQNQRRSPQNSRGRRSPQNSRGRRGRFDHSRRRGGWK
ncbi:protein fam98a-like protein [Anaeramoeba ignava]|uniref:Protein fam98a-like protein n=1 Tax=Anaeramoeba ignava TaxID=1746090 RepID=A0A9Q0LZ72_ANAIG|nr:protein fam98a-like protein [Anaeramoeba ignava]